MSPERLIGKVEYKQNLAGSNFLVRIGFEKEAYFVPGQYISLKVNEEGMRRSYSVASLPGKKTVDLLVDVSPMGVGSKYFLNLKVGDTVEALSFLGRFTVDPLLLFDAKQVLFVATGTGIAPFKPIIEDLLYNKHFGNEIRLVWGMRHEDDLYFLKEIDNIHRDFENFKFDIVMSQPKKDWPGYVGHVGDVVEKMSVGPETLVYLCGSSEMISEMEKKILEMGATQEHIFYEKYF